MAASMIATSRLSSSRRAPRVSCSIPCTRRRRWPRSSTWARARPARHRGQHLFLAHRRTAGLVRIEVHAVARRALNQAFRTLFAITAPRATRTTSSRSFFTIDPPGDSTRWERSDAARVPARRATPALAVPPPTRPHVPEAPPVWSSAGRGPGSIRTAGMISSEPAARGSPDSVRHGGEWGLVALLVFKNSGTRTRAVRWVRFLPPPPSGDQFKDVGTRE